MNIQAKELNSILKSEGSSAFSLLSHRGKSIFFPRKGLIAQGLDAKGKSINASIGEARDDDGSPLRLSILANKINLNPADAFPYASSFGKPELRDLWAKFIREKNPAINNVPLSRPVITNALTHGLSVAGYLFVDENDTIILPDQYWGNYRLIFTEAFGAILETFPTFTGIGKDASFNVEGLKERLLTPGDKKIVLLNFPNNPTGYTPTQKEMTDIIQSIEEAAKSGKTILVITDDAYFGLIYQDGICTQSPFAWLCNLHENIVACKIDGATKEDYAWGLRVGFITIAGKGLSEKALSALEDKAAGRVRASISNDSHLSQSLLLSTYRDPAYSSEKKRAYALLKSRYDAVVQELKTHPEYRSEFEALPYNSGYFMCVKIRKNDAEAVRQMLLNKYDTGVIALGDLVRVAYSCLPASDIPTVFANIYSACQEI